MDFCEKLIFLIEERGITKNKLLTDLKLNRNSFQNWQKLGAQPRNDTVKKIAEYFNVSAECLTEDSMDIEYVPSSKKSTATKLLSYYQRTVTILGGYEITDEKLNRISNCVDANVIFLSNISAKEYNPEVNNVKERSAIKTDDIFEVVELADKCADNEFVRVLMIQISKVILYRVAAKKAKCNAGDTNKYDLYSCKHLMSEKLDFLYSNEPCANPAMNFGFNLTEIITIHNYTGLSCEYLITGIENA